MCFNLRSLADEKKAKMGINECVNHGLITPFPVLVSPRSPDVPAERVSIMVLILKSCLQFEKEDEIVAQFKFTTLLMPNGPLRITGLPFDVAQYESDKKIDDEEILVSLFFCFQLIFMVFFQKVLAQSTSKKSKKKNKKKQAKKAAAEATEATA